jgi:hypothetical protein
MRPAVDEIDAAHRFLVHDARQLRHRQAEAVAHPIGKRHARCRIWNFVHRPLDLHDVPERVPHEVLGPRAPARHSGRQSRAPEDDGQHDEIVGEHGDLHLVVGDRESRLACLRHGAGRKSHAHRAAAVGCALGNRRDRVEI